MRREEVLKVLGRHREELTADFSVKSLRLFGSVARDEAEAESDIDLLIDFHKTPSLFEFLRLRTYLEDLLGAYVDLVTETGLKEHAREYVEQDAINVA